MTFWILDLQMDKCNLFKVRRNSNIHKYHDCIWLTFRQTKTIDFKVPVQFMISLHHTVQYNMYIDAKQKKSVCIRMLMSQIENWKSLPNVGWSVYIFKRCFFMLCSFNSIQTHFGIVIINVNDAFNYQKSDLNLNKFGSHMQKWNISKS